MKTVLLLEGPGWGGGNSTSIPLGVHPYIKHYKRGDIVPVDCPKGSEEEMAWEARIKAGMCQIMTGPRAPLKPAA